MIYKNVFYCFLIFWLFISSVCYGQISSGINTKTPSTTAILELNSSNKGFLIPRISVSNISNSAPVSPTAADGLLIYSTYEDISNNIKKTLYNWDVLGNNGNGHWNRHLYFKDTPKTAVIGLTGSNIAVLDGNVSSPTDPSSPGGPGTRAFVSGDSSNQLTIINSGHLPNLEVSKDAAGVRIKLGPGIYIYEISFLLSAPAAIPSSRAFTMGSSTYYNMGYYTDVIYRALPTPSDRYGRIENSVISQINNNHRVEFSMVVELTQNESYIYPSLGRRVGSTHYDLVNIVTSGTYIKLTKLK